MRATALALALAATATAGCETSHRVGVLLGPDDDTLSLGFLCRDDDGDLLLERLAGSDSVSIVVDFIGLDGQFPGCRSEELVTACADGRCQPLAPRGRRWCETLTVADLPASGGDPAALLDALYAALRSRPLISTDAPDEPVVLRVVSTLEPCDDIAAANTSGALPGLDPDLALGCAHSCPVLLDQVDGAVQVSLDTLTNRCAVAVRHCAAFPGQLP